MALTKRIIPCLDVNQGMVVKGINFKSLKNAGDPVELGKLYSDSGADELVFLDITASQERREILKNLVKDVAAQINIPFTVGGGIRTLEDARMILSNGADKIAINTAAVKNPRIISELAAVFGNQCIVVSIDVKRCYKKKKIAKKKDSQKAEELQYEVFTYGGRKPSGLDAIKWAEEVTELGAGEILLTSMDRDGTKIGFDLEITRAISNKISIPVIASGGAGIPKHFLEAFTIGKADAALAASVFHYNNYPISIVKTFLKEKGVLVRT